VRLCGLAKALVGTALVGTALVETALVETALVETALVDDLEPLKHISTPRHPRWMGATG